MRNITRHKISVALFVAMIISAAALSAQEEQSPSKPNPTGALLRSAFVPGFGQFYNRKFIKGTIIALGESYLIYGIYNDWTDANQYEKNFKNADDINIKEGEFNKYEDARDRRNFKMWILAATVFYSMFDAYVDAHLADFDQKDKSYEVFVAPKNDGLQLVLTLDIK